MKCFLFYLILIGNVIYGQHKNEFQKTNSKETYRLTLEGQYGDVLKTNFYTQNLTKPAYIAGRFLLSKQTEGEKLWEREHGLPSYGLGVLGVDFLENDDMGSPIAVFANYNANAKRWNNTSWNYYVNFGMSFGSTPYSYDYQNPSVSQKNNMYIGIGTSINQKIGKRFEAGLGLAFNHFSNGATNFPNKGLNFAAPQLSLTYLTGNLDDIKSSSAIDTVYTAKNTLEASAFYGKKKGFYRGEGRTTLSNLYDGYQFQTYGLDALYTKQLTFKSSLGMALQLSYDEEYNTTMYVQDSTLFKRNRFKNPNYTFGVMPVYRLNVDKMKVDIGLGYYPFKKTRNYDKTKLYQYVGLRYFINDRLFASFGINAFDFHRARYLEWRLGYTIFNKKMLKRL